MLIRLISINPVSDGRLGPVDTKKACGRFHHTLILKRWQLESDIHGFLVSLLKLSALPNYRRSLHKMALTCLDLTLKLTEFFSQNL
jgi:hypothetical protein